jgi:glucosamine kinase
MSKLALGIDGGGSKTLAVIVNEQGQELGRGQAGSSNQSNIGLEAALHNLHHAAQEAAEMADCCLPVSKAWIGLAGVDRPADYELILPHMQMLADNVRLTNDAELGLSALENAIGIVIIAGTGSIVLGRDARGQVKRAGGWGYLLGDEGSGYDLGRQALQAALRSADGRDQPTILLDIILRHWNLKAHTEIIDQVYKTKGSAHIARLAPCVFQAARQGDALAQKIIQQAAAELALAVQAVCTQLAFADVIPLALAGGLLVHEPAYRQQVLESIRQHHTPGQVAIVETPALNAARAARFLT